MLGRVGKKPPSVVTLLGHEVFWVFYSLNKWLSFLIHWRLETKDSLVLPFAHTETGIER